jgi:2-iminobutanoate/2-iminopropanoate deaminase
MRWHDGIIRESLREGNAFSRPLSAEHKEHAMREPFATDKLPTPRNPYSQAIITGGRQLWISGQVPLDPTTGEVIDGGFEQQAERVFENVRTLVEAAGGSLANAVKVQVFLTSFDHFEQMNAIYMRYFPAPRPARTTVSVDLRGFLIEVDVVVALD